MKTFLLPPGLPEPRVEFETVGGLELARPVVTPAVGDAVASAVARAQPALLGVRTEAILRAVDETLAEWLSPESAARRAAEAAFAARTGIPAATAPWRPLLEACAGGRVREWVRAEVEPLEALDGFAPDRGGRLVRALGPRLAVHVLPGNLPATWLPAFAACLLMRTPCLLKPAADDPLTPALFLGSLVRRLPELAPALAALPWTGGDAAVERAALRPAEAVFVYGGAEAVAGVAERAAPGARVIRHGVRVAMGVVARELAGPGRLASVAAAAARDALLYDGRGCLSLAAVALEAGGVFSPAEAVGEFARALEAEARALPPGRPDRDAAAVTQAWRARARARVIAGQPVKFFGSATGLDWALVYDEQRPPPPVALVRTLWVVPVPDLAGLPAALGLGPDRVHALAYAGPDSRRLGVAEALAPLGLTRLTPFGSLQAPPLTWWHGGSSPFRQLLRWTAVER